MVRGARKSKRKKGTTRRPVLGRNTVQAGIQQRLDAQRDASNVAWIEWCAPGKPGVTINIGTNKVILGDTSPVNPSLASCHGLLYLAWKGDGNDNLNVIVSVDNGATFGNKHIRPLGVAVRDRFGDDPFFVSEAPVPVTRPTARIQSAPPASLPHRRFSAGDRRNSRVCGV